MRAARIAIVCTTMLLLISSIALLPGTDSSDNPFTIELVNESKSPDMPLVKTTLIFTTYTSAEGIKYELEESTKISNSYYSLIINSDYGKYTVTVSIPDSEISGSLRESGMIVELTNGSTYKAKLDKDNGFSGVFVDANDDPANFTPNVLYKVSIFTENEIEGDSPTERTPDFTFRFGASPVNGCVVQFFDGETEMLAKVLKSGSELGTMPVPPAREGYEFIGWFDEDGKEYTEKSIITTDVRLHTRWVEIGPDPPGPDPPEPDERDITITEVIPHEDGSIETITTHIVEHKDGSKEL